MSDSVVDRVQRAVTTEVVPGDEHYITLTMTREGWEDLCWCVSTNQRPVQHIDHRTIPRTRRAQLYVRPKPASVGKNRHQKARYMSLTKRRNYWKPLQYDFAFSAYQAQNAMHWVPDEIPLGEDIRDWNDKMTPEEKNLVTHIFRFFTQGDVEVADNYMTRFMQVFRPPEVQMMLAAFANIEGVHIHAYSLLLDTLGLPEVEYSKFMDYKAMKDKHDLFAQFSVDSPREIAKTMAAFGGFVEGVQLFASFAILLNFTRFNRMKGMGKVIEWSMRDENLHSESITKLFRTYVKENRKIWDDSLKSEIYGIAEEMVKAEDAFVDLAFEMGPVQGLDPADVKTYVRYMADKRLLGLGMKAIFKQKTHPLPWIDALVGATKTNFFEARETGYSKGVTQGSWDDAFSTIFPKVA